MTVSGLTTSKGARHSDRIRDNQTQNRRSFVLIAGRFWVRFRMASCCRKARFSRAKLHRPLSEALKKQNSKDSNSSIPLECRALLQKINDINCYEALVKDNVFSRCLGLPVIGHDLCPVNTMASNAAKVLSSLRDVGYLRKARQQAQCTLVGVLRQWKSCPAAVSTVHRAFEGLELPAAKVARAVLRGRLRHEVAYVFVVLEYP
jgi:hypothetical protein